MIEWLTLLLCTQDVLGSNIGPETGYPKVFRGFPQFIKKNGHDHFIPRPFQFIIHLSFFHSLLYSLSN
jgi:hypothetical protein